MTSHLHYSAGMWLRPLVGPTRLANWALENVDNSETIDLFLKALTACRKFDTWDLPESHVREQIAARRPECYSRLAQCVYWAYAAKNKPTASRWGDKNNFHVLHVAEIDSLFPDCLFVHIVRDVRDVACSYRELKTLKSTSPYKPSLPSAP